MNRRVVIALFAVILSLPVAGAETELPADTAAHGSAEQAHEQAHPEEGHHEERTYFGIPGWILKLANMVLFFGVLWWLLKGPIANAFADRKASIRKRLSEADSRRERADRMAEEIQQRLDKVEDEIAAIRQRADEEGKRQSAQIDEAAGREAEKILAAARGEIDQRMGQARRELKQFAADLATDRATGLVEASINDADRSKLFDTSVERIREAKG